MPNDQTPIRTVTDRSSKHLRAIAFLFAATLLLVVAVALFVEAQRSEVKRNLTDNDNVHLIAVTYRSGGDDPRGLRFGDADRITAVANAAVRGRASATTAASFPMGLEGTGGQTYVVDGLIGGGLSRLLGAALPSPDGALSPTTGGDIVLRVPVVRSDGGGLSSDRTQPLTLHAAKFEGEGPIDVFTHRPAGALRVDGDTFARIVEQAFGADWQQFAAAHDSEANPYGFDAVRSVFVYIDHLDDVAPAAKAITAQGFDVDYTLKAFDDIAATADRSTHVAGGVLAVTLLSGGALITVNARSYLRLARRDMGVLLHYGYSRRFVAAHYRARILRLVLTSAMPAALAAVVGSLTVLGTERWLVTANLGMIAALLVIAYLAIGRGMLRRQLALPVLTLLKQDREFA